MDERWAAILAEDADDQEERDEELMRRWYDVQGMDYEAECRGAKEKLIQRIQLIARRSNQVAETVF